MNTEEFKNTVIPFARKLYPMVKQYLKNDEDVKDALQDLMMKFWNKKDDIGSAANMNSYIIAMARNYCLDTLKKKKPVNIQENDQKVLNIPVNEPGIETTEKLARVNQVIESLPEKYREVIRMRDIDGFTFEEITAVTGFEIPHLRVILSRSRLKVREELIKIYNYEKGTGNRIAQKVL